jgi:hypothetical protein
VKPVLFKPVGGPWEMFDRISSVAARMPSAVPPSQVVTRASIAALLGGGDVEHVGKQPLGSLGQQARERKKPREYGA